MTLCIDRAGIVGADGETHHGLYDISYLKSMPNMIVMAPKDGEELSDMIHFSAESDMPCAIRYPRGEAAAIANSSDDNQLILGKSERLIESGSVDIWATGNMVSTALETAQLLNEAGIDAGVVNVRFIKPFDKENLIEAAKTSKLIVTLEDGALIGGIGEYIDSLLINEDIRVMNLGWPDKFIEHGSAAELYDKYGLDAKHISQKIKSEV